MFNLAVLMTGQTIKFKKKNKIRFKCAKTIENEMNVVEWCYASPHSPHILQEIYDLIEDAEVDDEDEDEAMYYPGKLIRY